MTVSTATKLGESLIQTEQANQIQQLKTVGSQPRIGTLSPNVITATNAPSIAQPLPVSNVRVRVQHTSDVNSTVTVSFNRNQNDLNFSHAIVHVSNYQGNPQPVQVAAGQSPIRFQLVNTGEPVAVHVQSMGSLGPSPLANAPTSTFRLRNTLLATTSTPGGTGPPNPQLIQPVNLSNFIWLPNGGSSLQANPPASYALSDLPNGYIQHTASTAFGYLLMPTVSGTSVGGIAVRTSTINAIASNVANGILVWNSSTNKALLFFGEGTSLFVEQFTGTGSPTSIFTCSWGGGFFATAYARITFDGTNFNFYISGDGQHWIFLFQTAMSTWVGTPTHYGFVANCNSGTANAADAISVTGLTTY